MNSLIFAVCLFWGGPLNDHGNIRATPTRETMVVASHYGEGDGFDGKQMANGDYFRANDPTLAAHKTLPFGTKVKLTNPETKRSQVVVIKDRGPYEPGRDIDVSTAAAKKLGFKKKGMAKLHAQILAAP